MAARAVSVALLCLAFAAATASGAQQAPAPAVDCSSLILNMADCLSYVSNGSTVATPEGTCCTGLKTVLKADANCLCEAFKSSAQLGVVLNVTKALALPAACKVSAPAAAKCALSTAPTSAPALSPTSAASPTAAATPEVASGPASGIGAPALSPGASGSAAVSVSVGSVLVGLLVAAFSGF